MSDSELVTGGLPCPDCGGSDPLALYDDGHTHCFSCDTTTQPGSYNGPGGAAPGQHKKKPRGLLKGLEYQALHKRKITEETCRKFGYGIGETSRGKVQVAPYYDADRNLVGQKLRGRDKAFSWRGEVKPQDCRPFGSHVWPETGKNIVVTEGEIDALAMSQVQGNKWPVVSIPTGAGKKAVRKYMASQLEYFEGFDKVIIMFDMDPIGQEAAKAAAEVLGPRAHIAVLPLKDPGEMLEKGKVKELTDAMWRAKKHQPEGIVDLFSLREEVLKPVEWGLSYPWDELTDLTFGARLGELIAFGAGTGIGKTDVFTQIMQHFIEEHGEKLGVFALEQEPQQTAVRLVGKIAKKAFHVPLPRDATEEDYSQRKVEIATAWEAHVSEGMVYLYDSFGINEWESVASKIRYLRDAEGVRFFFLDHLTALAAGHEDERKALDNIMAEMGSLVKEVPITIFFISHLATPEGTPHEEGGRVKIRHFRGSRAIGFWSSYMIGLERNQQAESERVRATTTVRILKDRETGRATGQTFWLAYDHETGMLSSTTDPEQEGSTFGFEDATEEDPTTEQGDF